MSTELVDEGPHFRLVLGQDLQQNLGAITGQCHCTVVVSADIDADDYIDTSVIGDHGTHIFRLM